MSYATGIPDWVCHEHSEAGYNNGTAFGCSECAKAKARDEYVARLEDRLRMLEGTVEQLNYRIEEYRQENRDRDERGQM
jgi:TolA-binding protein